MAAPKGNQFAVGNSGKPKLWESPEALQADVDKYFDDTDNNPFLVHEYVGKNAESVERKVKRPYTIEGLALTLDCSRDTLLNYEKKDGYQEYFSIITRAKRRITQQKVEGAVAGIFNPSFTKFDLINNTNGDYKDKAQVDMGITDDIKTILFKVVLPKKLGEGDEEQDDPHTNDNGESVH